MSKQSILKKFLSITLLFLILFNISAKPATAAENLWFHSSFSDWYVKTFDDSNPTEIFGERYTAAQVQWVFYSIPAHLLTALTFGNSAPWICIFSADLGECISGALDVLDSIIKKVYDFFSFPIRLIIPGGSSEGTDNNQQISENFSLYGFLYNNPMSGSGYVLRKLADFSIVPTAKAQEGFGYSQGGAAVQKLWQITRNVSYFLLILVIIAMAFMIMFRIRISPQTVITIQSALPKIIFTLILITFSYAIAGFLIDLMYVVIGIFSFLVTQGGIFDGSATDLFTTLTNGSNVFFLSWQYVLIFLFGTASVIRSSSFGWGLLLLILLLVIFIITFVNGVKILWMMIKTYMNILLAIITAPLQILLGAITQSGGFSKWLKDFVANLAVYPAVGIMFFLTFFFVNQAAMFSERNIIWQWIGNRSPFPIKAGFLENKTAWDPPLTWGAADNGRFLWMLVSFAIYMSIPKVADIIKGMIEGKPFSYGSAVGESIKAPIVAAGNISATGTKIGTAVHTRFGTKTPSPSSTEKARVEKPPAQGKEPFTG